MPGFHSPIRSWRRIVLGLTGCFILGAGAAAGEIEYGRDVQPILSDNCYACHGPDAAALKAELRLDQRESALEHALVPGKPGESELVKRIRGDVFIRMPPVKSGLSLTEAEKTILEKWIAAGAKYTPHWSFRPLPERIAIPTVTSTDWPRQPIDNFVLARLEEAGVPHSPPASPELWLRRVAFDLTGLPPRLEDLTQLQKNWKHNRRLAKRRAVDRLLASPAFGEHLAVGWLDAARYADSYGLQSDKLNTQWPYRDWVVSAFNRNMPYDKFVTWQIAGDLLENPTREQILATAFNRLHRLTPEGGSIPAEWIVRNAADRVRTFGTVFLGLTLRCARCHDHKFDPILSRDYYSIFAFFNSIDENGLYDNPRKIPSPSLLLPTPEQERGLKVASRAITAAEAALAASIEGGEGRFRRWLESAGRPETLPDLASYFSFDNGKPPFSNLAPGGAGTGTGKNLSSVPGVRGAAVELNGDDGVVFKKIRPIDRWTPLTVDFWMRDEGTASEPRVILQKTFGTDSGYNGFDIMLADGRLSARLYRVWPGNAIGIRTTEPLELDQWRHITLTYDGSSEAAGLTFYVNGGAIESTVLRDHTMYKKAGVNVFGDGHFTIGARFRDRGFENGQIDEFRLFRRALSPLEIAELASPGTLAATLNKPQEHEDRLREYYFSAIDSEARARRDALEACRKKFVALQGKVHEVMVMRARPEPRPTHVLARGAYDAPRSTENRVSRDVFTSILPPFPDDAPRNRLGLAQWLTLADHPLTARVFVNRIWANFFGRGLVATPADFGRQGARPTHPELVDWLARDFVASGWNIKHLCRRIALSATYAQASHRRPELKNKNPANKLLARGPSGRLAAEQIRDLALASSGLLTRKLGGPPVSPYQPGDDLWRENNRRSPPYEQSTGSALYRRSLYSVRKRTAPLPNMIAFDAPAHSVCVVKRSPTNTPMQALVLLNDVQFVEAARHLAEETMIATESDAERVTFAFRRVCARPPDAAERQLLLALLDGQRQRFGREDGQDADALIAVGESKPDPELAGEELAALTIVCQAILNLDAAIWLR